MSEAAGREYVARMATEPRTLCAAFQQTAAAHPDVVALRTPDDSVSITWGEYAARVRKVAAGLAGLGVARGDTVAIMLTNRPEFHVVDAGALHAGATPFSVYNTLATDQIGYLFGNAGNKVVITERQFLDKLKLANTDGQIEHFICVDGAAEGAMTLEELEASGDAEYHFDAGWQAVEPSDVLTLIYTSGTTGPPKGVELTHANLMAEMDALKGYFPLSHEDSLVSYLPDAHIANRWGAHYNNMRFGIQITMVADPSSWSRRCRRPPHVLRRGAGGLVQGQGRHRGGAGRRARREEAQDRQLGDRDRHQGGLAESGRSRCRSPSLQHGLAERLVLGKLRERMGLDRVRVAAPAPRPSLRTRWRSCWPSASRCSRSGACPRPVPW